MASPTETLVCKNSTYGCDFASSSTGSMINHFQEDCAFHPVRCFKCNKMVQRANFALHYMEFCRDSSTPQCLASGEAPDVPGAKTEEGATSICQEQHFLQECVRECTLSVDSLCHAMKDVAADVAEVKAMKVKQEDLEAIVNKQSNLINELSKCIMTNIEKTNKLKEDVGAIVKGVDKVDDMVEEVAALTRGIARGSKVHWYVQDVSQYIEKAKTERSMLLSDVFVVRGYSAKLWFEVKNIEGVLYIALYFCLCQGPSDSLLQWPFSTPYSLSLIHLKDASKTKQLKITPAFTASGGFPKPEDTIDVGHGKNDFCSVEEALNQGFIESDAICVAVTLHEERMEGPLREWRDSNEETRDCFPALHSTVYFPTPDKRDDRSAASVQ